jgi:hypothetical protein
MFAVVAFGDASPSPLPGAPGPSINWPILLAAGAALGIAILDFIFAVNPSARANGFLHWVYLALGGKDTPPPSIK